MGFTAENDLHPSNEIIRKRAAHLVLQTAQNLSHAGRSDMLCRINTEAGETNREEICKVSRNAILYIRLLGVEIRQTNKPTLSDNLSVGPGIEGQFTVEVCGSIWYSRELEGGSGVCERINQMGVSRGEVRRSICCIVSGVLDALGSLVVLDIRTLARHVVDDCVRIDSDTGGSAGLDHGAELCTGAHAGGESIAYGLVTISMLAIYGY